MAVDVGEDAASGLRAKLAMVNQACHQWPNASLYGWKKSIWGVEQNAFAREVAASRTSTGEGLAGTVFSNTHP